ncbi:MAG: redox-regulated ATPase YchF, partial [SAR202 cluster bacterium]|nr:redox-regulated ATPase YchF [SAR202 cluster bacterium]
MAIGIIGLPLGGKTTIFNAVTRGHAQTAGHRTAGQQPNIGVAKVPDPRLAELAKISKPKKVTPAEVQYIDIPSAPEGLGKTKGIGGEFLNQLQRCEALLLVVRAFENPAVPHVDSTIDPYRDAATMMTELAFSDMGLLERRETRIQQSMRSAKASERDALTREAEQVKAIREALEREVPVREQEVPAEAKATLENYQLLTQKPLIVVFNIGEGDLAREAEIEREAKSRLERPGVAVATVAGKLEMELAQMPLDEER